MITALAAFGSGFILGIAFALVGLPIPAPGTLAGVAGVAGVTCAFLLVKKVRP